MLKEIIINKKGFLVYTDYWDKYFNDMSGDQVKECLKIIFHYNKTFEILPTKDLAVKMVINTILDNINRDADKREKQRKASSLNGRLGGRPKTEAKRKQTRSKTEANKNVNINLNVNGECKLINENKNIILPNFIKDNLWSEFLAMRKKLKAPNTEMALNRILKKLKAFEQQNIGNGTLAIENSIENGWKGVFEPKATRFNKNNSNNSFDTVFKEIKSEQFKLK